MPRYLKGDESPQEERDVIAGNFNETLGDKATEDDCLNFVTGKPCNIFRVQAVVCRAMALYHAARPEDPQ